MAEVENNQDVRGKLSQYAYSGDEGSIMDDNVMGYSTPVAERTSNTKRKAVSPLAELYQKSLEENPSNSTDTMVTLLKSLEKKVDDMDLSLGNQDKTIDELCKDNAELKERCRINEGRITRIEKLNSDLQEEVLRVNARAMQENIVFQNIAETESDERSLRDVLYEFMAEQMEMTDPSLNQVVINKIYRQG